MKLWKILVPLALCLVLVLAILPATAEASTISFKDLLAAAGGVSGACGENLTWKLDNAGTLTISGTGPMDNYDIYPSAPWYDYKNSIKKVVIEDGVTTIGSRAFHPCTVLAEVSLGSGISAIGDYAFSTCTALTEITIPDNVNTIGEYAFWNCSSLATITIGKGVHTIEEVVFDGCTALTGIRVDPENTSYSSDSRGVLFNKEKTVLLRAPAAISGSYAISQGVKTIAPYAFSGCVALTGATVSDSVEQIGEWAFSGCRSLVDITMGKCVTAIGARGFANCKALTGIDLPDSLTTIYNHAFLYCEKLARVNLGNGVELIGENAFYGCSALEAVTIPNSTLTICWAAFGNCTSLTEIFIPASVTRIEMAPFAGCTSLNKIQVDPLNTKYCSDSSGVLYSKDMTVLIQAPGKLAGSYRIADAVEDLGNQAFAGCAALKDVTIPGSVALISTGAFYQCAGLTDVYYQGTAGQWSRIRVFEQNEQLLNATFHFSQISGDMDGDDKKTTDDAVYLLLSLMFGTEDYPVPDGMDLDFNGDGKVNTDDAVYLLLHVMFGEEDYPLSA